MELSKTFLNVKTNQLLNVEIIGKVEVAGKMKTEVFGLNIVDIFSGDKRSISGNNVFLEDYITDDFFETTPKSFTNACKFTDMPATPTPFAVCVFDIKRNIHRFKIIPNPKNLSSPEMEDVISHFGYEGKIDEQRSLPFKVTRFTPVINGQAPQGDWTAMGWLYWEALLYFSKQFTVEYDPNDSDPDFCLVDDKNLVQAID